MAIAVIASVAGKKDQGSNQATSNNTTQEAQSAVQETETEIEYTPYTAQEMIDDLDSNAMNATDKYKGKYIQVTGKLSNIDAQGAYISLTSESDSFSLISIQCFIKSDEQKEAIKSLNKGDQVIIRGKCTDVGEVLGYSVTIDSIG